MRVSEQTKFDIISRNNIVDIINQYVPLKKAGKNYQACCPFHQEKTPSFSVSEEKQFYHCFGCGAHGDMIDFLQNFSQLSFMDALQYLADRVGYTLAKTAEQAATQEHLQPLFELMQFANQFYQQALRQVSQSQAALDYLKQRGLSKSVLIHYQVGFAPAGWDNLLIAAREKGFTDTQLIKTGLAIKNDKGKVYDRFRNRIIFPILDTRGRTIGFGGRVLDDSEPKYLNSPETPLFHKGADVYGWHQAAKLREQFGEVLFIVEGYMDVLALAQFELTPTVATLGTATTKTHLQSLFRHRMPLVFCFDGDTAGQKAALRALTQALPLMDKDYDLLFMHLPLGSDPDSLLRQAGKAAFLNHLKQAKPWADYLFESLQTEIDITTLTGRTSFARKALAAIDTIPPGMTHTLLLDNLASRVHIDVLQLRKLSDPKSEMPHLPNSVPSPNRAKGRHVLTPIDLALALVLREPSLAMIFPNPAQFSALPIPGAALLAKLVNKIRAQTALDTNVLLQQWDAPEEQVQLRALQKAADHVPAAGLSQEWQDTLARIIHQAKQHKIQQLLSLAKSRGLGEAQLAELNRLIHTQKQPEN